MKTRFAVVAVSLLAAAAFADDKKAPEKKEAAPALPAEVKKTVDAMAGKWAMEGTITGMSKDPMKVKETFTCKKAAGGRAVYCNGKANVPGMGAVEDEALVTWDVEGKALRFVGVSST